MGDADAAFGHQVVQVFGEQLDVGHFVVQKIYLPAAAQFTLNGLDHHAVVPLGHGGLDGDAVGRRRGDDRQVAQARQAHVEGARNGGGGERQQIDVGAQVLEFFLVTHAEAVLLVDHHQAEILELHVGLQQPVGADHHIERAFLKLIEHGLLLFGGAHP